MSTPDLPNAASIPAGTIAFPMGESVVYIRRCDVCYAAVIETHDADFQEHMEWHDRTGTNVLPTA